MRIGKEREKRVLEERMEKGNTKKQTSPQKCRWGLFEI